MHQLLNQGYTEVVDADLKGYFDTIPHHELMKKYRWSCQPGAPDYRRGNRRARPFAHASEKPPSSQELLILIRTACFSNLICGTSKTRAAGGHYTKVQYPNKRRSLFITAPRYRFPLRILRDKPWNLLDRPEAKIPGK